MFVTNEDLDGLAHILDKKFELEEHPNIVFHVYKNRRSQFNNIKVWSRIDLGTCRIKNLFITDNNYNLKPAESIEIDVV